MKNKSTITQNIKIQHETFGVILNQQFYDSVQFKLFLQMTQSCLELGNDLTFFDGVSQLLHVPHKHLKNSIITTNIESWDLTDHMRSKLETLM